MIDENAFGILVSDFNLEDEEYQTAREEFGARLQRFRDTVFDYVSLHALATDARALDLGHAVYFEFGEGEQLTDPIGWMRALRALLSDEELVSFAVLTHGSRWVDEEHGVELEVEQRYVGSMAVARFSNSSEPLRRALYAETASRPGDDDIEGWGPGAYVDTEALESLGLSPKNAPTSLGVAGATFYRVGR